MYVIDFSKELQNAEFFPVGSTTDDLPATLKILETMARNICGRLEYKYQWQIGQPELLKRNSTGGILGDFPKLLNIPRDMYQVTCVETYMF